MTSTGAAGLNVIDGGPKWIPGLYGRITVPTNGVVVLTTSGGIVNTGLPGDHVRVDVRLVIDTVAVDLGSYDVERGNFANIGHWSFSFVPTLSPGVHTVGVDAILTGFNKGNAANPFPAAAVGGAEDTSTHGTLTAVVLKQ